jgi:hypothetical protein
LPPRARRPAAPRHPPGKDKNPIHEPPGQGQRGTFNMLNLHIQVWPLVDIVAGVLILIAPKILNYVIAIYLILIGLFGPMGLFHII